MTSASDSLYMEYDHCAGWTYMITFPLESRGPTSYIVIYTYVCVLVRVTVNLRSLVGPTGFGPWRDNKEDELPLTGPASIQQGEGLHPRLGAVPRAPHVVKQRAGRRQNSKGEGPLWPLPSLPHPCIVYGLGAPAPFLFFVDPPPGALFLFPFTVVEERGASGSNSDSVSD